jgi:hypothetical protein
MGALMIPSVRAYCTFTPTPPADLLPLQAGQILLPLPGGSAMIDNVVVETNIEDFGGMVQGEKYLLFLNLDTNQQGVVPIGPQGVLHVNSDSTFAPVMMLAQCEFEPVSSGLTTQYGNSLIQLRAAFNQQSSCDPCLCVFSMRTLAPISFAERKISLRRFA